MQCENCNHLNTARARFCAGCGTGVVVGPDVEVDAVDGAALNADVTNSVDVAPITVQLSDGTTYGLSGRYLVGRNPKAKDEYDVDGLIMLTDNIEKTSKTHLFLEVKDGHLWVMDLGSTNGTIIQFADGSIAAECNAHEFVLAPPDTWVAAGLSGFWVTQPSSTP